MATQRDTVKLLCKSIINRLENAKTIAFPPRLRQVIQDELFVLLGPGILTEQDLRERALARMGARAEMLQDAAFAESDQYKAAKAVVKSTFGDDELNGFFFQVPVRELATRVAGYLMRSSHIEDVFENDEDIEKRVIDTIKTFNPENLH